MKLRLNLSPVVDPFIRTAFEKIQFALAAYTLGFFYCYRINYTLVASSYPATVTPSHTLGQTPTDVIQTYVSGGTATWNIDKFTATHLSVTISAALTVRGFAGIYRSDL